MNEDERLNPLGIEIASDIFFILEVRVLGVLLVKRGLRINRTKY